MFLPVLNTHRPMLFSPSQSVCWPCHCKAALITFNFIVPSTRANHYIKRTHLSLMSRPLSTSSSQNGSFSTVIGCCSEGPAVPASAPAPPSRTIPANSSGPISVENVGMLSRNQEFGITFFVSSTETTAASRHWFGWSRLHSSRMAPPTPNAHSLHKNRAATGTNYWSHDALTKER